MIDVVGIKFLDGGRIYYFSPGKLDIKPGDYVIVETERGVQLAISETGNTKIEKEKAFLPLKEVVRKADNKDIEKEKKNRKQAEQALIYAKEIVEKENIDMKLYEASYTFDKSKLILKFIADERVDFRELAKKLAAKYKTRIELRQIGVRDKAKEIGGLGPCGRPLCCSEFLTNFDSVSINMAKNQGIALNPTKINGSCGRLLCCLGYEDQTYSKYKKLLPKEGQLVKKDGKEGRVINLDVLNLKYKFITDDDEIIEVVVNNNESSK